MKHLNKVIISLVIIILGVGQYFHYDQQWENQVRDERVKQEYAKKLRTIVVYIKDVNPNVSVKKAKLFAKTIIEESEKRGIDPLLQTALLKSESTFYTNPNHGIKEVKGMGGVYWKWWKNDLKKHNICDTICDLEDPIINIEASAYILSEYKKKYKDTAVAHYKGYSALGKSQARKVKLTYANLQKKYEVA